MVISCNNNFKVSSASYTCTCIYCCLNGKSHFMSLIQVFSWLGTFVYSYIIVYIIFVLITITLAYQKETTCKHKDTKIRKYEDTKRRIHENTMTHTRHVFALHVLSFCFAFLWSLCRVFYHGTLEISCFRHHTCNFVMSCYIAFLMI